MTDAAEHIIALVGSRKRIPAVLADITYLLERKNRSAIIVTGCQEGTDLHVRRECKRLGFRYVEFHARWTIGPEAGPERNALIADFAQRVIAWPASPEEPWEERQKSLGTWNCVKLFRDRGKPVVVREVAWKTG